MVMKIMDWMHRKLHPVTNYSRVSHRNASAFEEDVAVHNFPAAAKIEQDIETSVLHMLDGILSIGTLGHPHPILSPQHVPEQEETEIELPEKEVAATTEKPPVRITLLHPAVEMFVIKTEQSNEVVFDFAEEKRIAEVPLLKEDSARKERTTLADLIASELDAAVVGPAADAGKTKRATAVMNMPTVSTAKGRDMVKNKLEKKNKVNEVDSSKSFASTKRIRRMLTRMVKKKIHPEAPAGKVGEAGVSRMDSLLLNHGGGGGAAA